jgi:YidC/Oxa1 family membrane protein insertase
MDKRFFLALFLSLIVIAVSQLLFPPPEPAAVTPDATAKDSAVGSDASSTQPAVQPAATTTPAITTAPVTTPSRPGGSPAKPSDTAVARAAEIITVNTPKAIYKFSNIGATPVSVVTRDYQNRSGLGGPVDLSVGGSPLLGYQVVTPTDTVDLSQVPFSLSRAANPKGDEILTYSAAVKNVPVSIAYSIPRDTAESYVVRVSGRVEGIQGRAYLVTELPRTLQPTEADTVEDYRTLAYSFKPQRENAGNVLFGDLDPGERVLETGPLNWAAVKSKYFVLGVLASSDGTPFSEITLTGGPRTSKFATTASAGVVQEIRNNEFSFDIYAGPQESQRLIRMGRDFDHVNPYGWRFLQTVVHPIASKAIEFLLWMHNRLNLSYGWVLIVLGILVRLVLWPLNQSTMRSSLKMQELQPKLQAAQKKYKDPVQQREAIMKVYKDAGVSPFAGLTGCLPALLPMPVLFALFFVFQNTIEFRGVPFMWLHDISVKDPFYILPLLMGASMYVLSWIGMRNAPPNPQAKMMMYMFPVMMTVVLLNMASGLNLYYTAQNIAALPQQWLLARERARARAAG